MTALREIDQDGHDPAYFLQAIARRRKTGYRGKVRHRSKQALRIGMQRRLQF